jgi:riboflavin biosynthesis pyrimidine reductase
LIDFDQFAARKVREAERARLTALSTLDDKSGAFDCVTIGNDWSRYLYDGPFHLASDHGSETPLVSLVFVQSRDGNTGADNPDSLGGGPVDKHLIYEGLSRVAVDGVLSGAKSVGQHTFFSVWHPELVSLRTSLGLPRHPAQIIVTGTGCVDLERALVFNVPAVPVFILSTASGCERLAQAVSQRQGIELIAMSHDQLRAPLSFLRRERGIRRISAVGGRTTASALVDQNLVQDVLLTTTARVAGEPNTPFYNGSRTLELQTIVRKKGTDPEFPIVFEHSTIAAGSRNLFPRPVV